ADRMLDMGFIPDIERIFKMTPPKKQTLFFSATMPPEITRLTKQFLRDPVRIEATRPATTNVNITQLMVKVPSSDPKAKRLALRALIEKAHIETGIVFCNRKTEVDVVAKSLRSHGFDAAAIHGDLDQSQRMKTLAAFRDGSLKILVASDVAARGLDIPAVSHVFNYDVPHHADDYVHRIGRTGRAGRSGITYMLVTPGDDKGFDKVVKLIGSTPDEEKLDLDYSQAVTVQRDGDRKRGGRGAPPSRDRGGEREQGERSARGGRGARTREVEAAPVEGAAPAEVTTETAGAAVETREARPARVRGERKPRERAPRADRPERTEAVEAPDAVETVAVVEAEAPPARERGRDRGRGRSERAVRPDRAEAPVAARAEVSTPPEQGQDRARPDRAERPERETRPTSPVRGVQPIRGREDDDDRRVVGFGSDTPAFLMRATPGLTKASTDD
ncbi:MAG: DEAD/DEAH box helicase, partial [Alphaproteobacteria bacterium]|nr:DEAD/DEAH box helicase [Alphaproteobacteria bacterium]